MNKEMLFELKERDDYKIFKLIKFSESTIWSMPVEQRTEQYQELLVKHRDGSEFKFREVFCRYAKVGESTIIVVFPEHTIPTWYYIDDIAEVLVTSELLIIE